MKQIQHLIVPASRFRLPLPALSCYADCTSPDVCHHINHHAGTMKQIQHLIVPASRFRLLLGKEDLTLFQVGLKPEGLTCPASVCCQARGT